MRSAERRIEDKPSRTAAWTCTCRALSHLESDSQYKSGDYIAPELLPGFLSVVFRADFCRKLFINTLIPNGMYEYVIARTKYFDSVLGNALASGFEQILIFGAGYDSRGIRYLSGNTNIKLYELDAPKTQNAKINQLMKRGIDIPPNIVFVKIDFNKESLKDKLIEAGFDKRKKSLFMLEGITMYLDQEAVDSTFRIIDEFAAIDSEIVFDYVQRSVLKRENTLYGEERIFQTVKNANEEWSFGIDRGYIKAFLKTYHFDVIENLSSDDLEDRYFSNEPNKENGKINATHCIAHAITR